MYFWVSYLATSKTKKIGSLIIKAWTSNGRNTGTVLVLPIVCIWSSNYKHLDDKVSWSKCLHARNLFPNPSFFSGCVGSSEEEEQEHSFQSDPTLKYPFLISSAIAQTLGQTRMLARSNIKPEAIIYINGLREYFSPHSYAWGSPIVVLVVRVCLCETCFQAHAFE